MLFVVALVPLVGGAMIASLELLALVAFVKWCRDEARANEAAWKAAMACASVGGPYRSAPAFAFAVGGCDGSRRPEASGLARWGLRAAPAGASMGA